MIDFEDVFDLIIGADKTDEESDKIRLNINKYRDWEYISFWEQYHKLQNFAFDLDSREVFISQDFANYLNEKYFDLMLEAEEEKEIDLSGDYIMDFNRWVKGRTDALICW